MHPFPLCPSCTSSLLRSTYQLSTPIEILLLQYLPPPILFFLLPTPTAPFHTSVSFPPYLTSVPAYFPSFLRPYSFPSLPQSHPSIPPLSSLPLPHWRRCLTCYSIYLSPSTRLVRGVSSFGYPAFIVVIRLHLISKPNTVYISTCPILMILF